MVEAGLFLVKYHRNYAITLFTTNSRLLQVIFIFRFRNYIPQFTLLHHATTVIEKVFRSSLNALHVFMFLFFVVFFFLSFCAPLLAMVYGPVNLPSHRNSNEITPAQLQTDMHLKLFVRYLNKALTSGFPTASDVSVFLVCRVAFDFVRIVYWVNLLNHQVVANTFSFHHSSDR